MFSLIESDSGKMCGTDAYEYSAMRTYGANNNKILLITKKSIIQLI